MHFSLMFAAQTIGENSLQTTANTTQPIDRSSRVFVVEGHAALRASFLACSSGVSCISAAHITSCFTTSRHVPHLCIIIASSPRQQGKCLLSTRRLPQPRTSTTSQLQA